MSFGINGPDSHMPAIQKSHHANDGGAGNLGYFQQEKQQQEEEQPEADSFTPSKKEVNDREDLNMQELISMSNKIKGFLYYIKNKFRKEKKSEDK